MPPWLRGDVIDVRKIVSAWSEFSRVHGLQVRLQWSTTASTLPSFRVLMLSIIARPAAPHDTKHREPVAVPRSCPVRGKATQWNRCEFPSPPGNGYNHRCPYSQDARNIARIIIELARRGVRLVPNTPIWPDRRWPWMGKSGQVLEQYCLTPH